MLLGANCTRGRPPPVLYTGLLWLSRVPLIESSHDAISWFLMALASCISETDSIPALMQIFMFIILIYSLTGCPSKFGINILHFIMLTKLDNFELDIMNYDSKRNLNRFEYCGWQRKDFVTSSCLYLWTSSSCKIPLLKQLCMHNEH